MNLSRIRPFCRIIKTFLLSYLRKSIISYHYPVSSPYSELLICPTNIFYSCFWSNQGSYLGFVISIWTYFHNTLRSIQLLYEFTKMPASKQRNKHKCKHEGRMSHSRTLYFSFVGSWSMEGIKSSKFNDRQLLIHHKFPAAWWVSSSKIPQEERKRQKSCTFQGLPGGSAVRNPPANAGSITDPGRCQGATKHHNYWGCVLEPGSCKYCSLRALESMLQNKRGHHHEKPDHHN